MVSLNVLSHNETGFLTCQHVEVLTDEKEMLIQVVDSFLLFFFGGGGGGGVLFGFFLFCFFTVTQELICAKAVWKSIIFSFIISLIFIC